MSSEVSFRPLYHVTAPQGRLNDPNGVFISPTTGRLHVFYQKDPAFPFGKKRTGWGHVSTDLSTLEWVHHPDALYPDAPYDLDGCYSGGAVVDGDQVYLFYTGNLKQPVGDGFERKASQNVVFTEDVDGPLGGVYRRSPGNPVIPAPAAGYTAHYRDPMITRDGDGWRMVTGAQRADETGAVVLYRSPDLLEWEFVGELEFDITNASLGLSPDVVPGGFMWECPNLLTMRDVETGEDLDVLIICPQGLEPITVNGVTHYASSDQCGYVVGKLSGTRFEVLRGFSELDYGHQFYAPQIVSQADGSGLLLGWMGLPAQDDTPSVAAEGWVHCLTVPRRVELRGHVLVQSLVVPESIQNSDENHNEPGVLWHVERLGGHETTLTITGSQGTIGATIHYLSSVEPVLEINVAGVIRTIPCPPGDLTVFVDRSAVELTAAEGHISCSFVTFPQNNEVWDTITVNCD
ncbi:MAG: glycoside hydrolase family 32 protein [Corynebacterium sp.]|nr:glycoside hydrolase family 32 protein [Corynebacterium sp.]